MFKLLSRLFTAFFAPAFELLGDLPPQAVTRLAMPF
jgi:hypothetical protein